MKIAIFSWLMSSGSIIVGLNGALQKRFILQPETSLVPGNVHRATSIQTGVGGKGQDVAISLSCLGCMDNLQLVQFVGSGPEGDMVQAMLQRRLGEDSIKWLTVRTASAMRTCTTIVSSEESTELVEPSGIVTEDEWNELLERLKTKVSNPSSICIMGSLPPGLQADTYATIYKAMASRETLCVIDSIVGLDQTIKALSGRAILKINASELCQVVGVKKTKSEVNGISYDELLKATTAFNSKFNELKTLEALAITDGRHPSHLVSLDDTTKFQVYKIATPTFDPTKVLYPIGAGDSVAAGTLASWTSLETKAPMMDEIQSALKSRLKATTSIPSPRVCTIATAFAFGLACGSASCLNEENSVLHTHDVLRLFESIPLPELVE
jgi:fructose-1-phosphate kinase PfkB-like protein